MTLTEVEKLAKAWIEIIDTRISVRLASIAETLRDQAATREVNGDASAARVLKAVAIALETTTAPPAAPAVVVMSADDSCICKDFGGQNLECPIGKEFGNHPLGVSRTAILHLR